MTLAVVKGRNHRAQDDHCAEGERDNGNEALMELHRPILRHGVRVATG